MNGDSQWSKQEACYACATQVWLAVNHNTSVTSGEWIWCWKRIAQASEPSSCQSNVCLSWGFERLQKSKDSLKDCFENVNIRICMWADWWYWISCEPCIEGVKQGSHICCCLYKLNQPHTHYFLYFMWTVCYQCKLDLFCFSGIWIGNRRLLVWASFWRRVLKGRRPPCSHYRAPGSYTSSSSTGRKIFQGIL